MNAMDYVKRIRAVTTAIEQAQRRAREPGAPAGGFQGGGSAGCATIVRIGTAIFGPRPPNPK